MSRRADRKTQTEERILDAALQVFAHAGYAAATMDGIAEAAGLSKPTLYNYFASKDLLFRAMLHQPRDEMTLAIDTEADGDHVRPALALCVGLCRDGDAARASVAGAVDHWRGAAVS